MKYDYPQTQFSKTLMAGVFAGIIATLINLAFDFFFRGFVQLSPSEFINVSSIIFATMLLFTMAGLVYYFISDTLKKGNVVYIILFSALTLICVYFSLHVNRSAIHEEVVDFRELLIGTVLLSGTLAAFFIPYLVKHDTFFC